ncbi:MAG: hypothetical protein FWH12_08285 [Treponema sp.]|nr:hypothetical protein [Treponema sp.]
MEFCYVLSSSPADTYYEQFLLSLTSLKLVLPGAQVVLLCDEKTAGGLYGNRGSHGRFISRQVVCKTPDNMRAHEAAPAMLCSLNRHVQGEFLYLHCDTIICEAPNDLSVLGIDYGACLEGGPGAKQYSTALIYSSGSPETHRFFGRWNELWSNSFRWGTHQSGPSFNEALAEDPSLFTALPPWWNCPINAGGLPHLAQARIIHYNASLPAAKKGPYLLGRESVLLDIKHQGQVPPEVLDLLQNPRGAFHPQTRLALGPEKRRWF